MICQEKFNERAMFFLKEELFTLLKAELFILP